MNYCKHQPGSSSSVFNNTKLTVVEVCFSSSLSVSEATLDTSSLAILISLVLVAELSVPADFRVSWLVPGSCEILSVLGLTSAVDVSATSEGRTSAACSASTAPWLSVVSV